MLKSAFVLSVNEWYISPQQLGQPQSFLSTATFIIAFSPNLDNMNERNKNSKYHTVNWEL